MEQDKKGFLDNVGDAVKSFFAKVKEDNKPENKIRIMKQKLEVAKVQAELDEVRSKARKKREPLDLGYVPPPRVDWARKIDGGENEN